MFAVPLNSITETLFYNHRMLIDSLLYNSDSEPRAWLISKINRISPDGIVRVTLAQDLFDQHHDYIERDDDGNVLGMWADYYQSSIEPTPISTSTEEEYYSSITSTITCSGKPQYKIGGSAKTFTTTYIDSNGEPMDISPDGWSFYIDDESVANSLLTLTINDNKVKVKFLGDDSYIGKILTVKSTYNSIEASLDVELIAL